MKYPQRFLSAALCIALSACVSAPTTRETVQVSVETLQATRRYEHAYVLQAGDQLEVFLHRHGDLTRKVTVRPDGYISLPLLDEVKAAGKTPKDLAAELLGLYARRLREPDVNVIVLNPPEPVVYVVGQVGTPRAVPLRQAVTLAQVLAQSGDVTRMADASSVSVIRLNEQGVLQSHLIQGGGRSLSQPEVYMAMAAMRMQANDLVVVPESVRSQLVRNLQDTSIAITPLLNVLLLRELSR